MSIKLPHFWKMAFILKKFFILQDTIIIFLILKCNLILKYNMECHSYYYNMSKISRIDGWMDLEGTLAQENIYFRLSSWNYVAVLSLKKIT